MKVDIHTQNYELKDDLHQYITKKMTKLEHYVPRHARKAAHAEVFLREHKAQSTNPYECEIVFRLPHLEVVAKEATINMFAAVDIGEAKVKNQLLRYKEKATEHHTWRSRTWRRMRTGGQS